MKQLRIATLGDYDNYYSAFLYGTMEGAIRAGAWFRPIPLFGKPLSEIQKQIDWFKPHLLFCHMIFNTKPHNRDDVFQMLRNVKKNNGTKIAYHAGDARSIPRYEDNISDFVDLGLCNHGLWPQYSKIWKIPCIHWPYMAFYQSDIASKNPLYECQVAFTGALDDNTHHNPRANFITLLRRHLDVKTFPTPETGNTRFQTAELSATAETVLGVQMGLDIPSYVDVRPWQYIGSGALYFHDKCEIMEALFEEGKHFVPYKRDCHESYCDGYAKYVRKEPELGQKIRREGFKYVQAHHSTKQRVEEVTKFFGFNIGE